MGFPTQNKTRAGGVYSVNKLCVFQGMEQRQKGKRSDEDPGKDGKDAGVDSSSPMVRCDLQREPRKKDRSAFLLFDLIHPNLEPADQVVLYDVCAISSED